MAVLLSIEPAKPEDAKAILTLKRDAWLQTYVNAEQGITAEDILKAFSDADLDQAIKNWQKAIANETDDSPKRTFVAKIDGKVVGYTSPDNENGKKQLGAMYVATGAQGQGVGSKLLKKAIEWHGRSNDIYAYAVSYNSKAIGFYEHFGFKKTGVERPEEIDENGIKLLPDIEMVLKAN